MYVIPIILLVIALIFIIIFHFRKRAIIRKIKLMTFKEKCELLNEITEPFGYSYEPAQDIFSTTLNAWQRQFGFMHAYDVSAPYFNMVYDYQTVYFNYEERTWLIEFWKGQYGITTGCEIGVYHADTIISPEKYASTLFDAASDDELLPLCITLRKKGKCLGTLSRPHWWLTMFDLGMYSKPKTLSMEISIGFPDCGMMTAFRDALMNTMPDTHINVRGHNVSFSFTTCRNHYSLWKRIVRCFVMFWCRFFRWLFCFITRPFRRSGDKILYLYFYLPWIFRKTLRLHRVKK